MRQQYAAWIGILGILAMLTGCDWVTETGPEQVRLRIDGEVDAVDLITSQRFLVSRTPGTGWEVAAVLVADTTRVRLPFEQTYDISDDQRFLARVPNLQDDYQLRMRGWIDGEQRYDQSSATIPADSTLQIMYVFGNGRAPDDGGRL